MNEQQTSNKTSETDREVTVIASCSASKDGMFSVDAIVPRPGATLDTSTPEALAATTIKAANLTFSFTGETFQPPAYTIYHPDGSVIASEVMKPGGSSAFIAASLPWVEAGYGPTVLLRAMMLFASAVPKAAAAYKLSLTTGVSLQFAFSAEMMGMAGVAGGVLVSEDGKHSAISERQQQGLAAAREAAAEIESIVGDAEPRDAEMRVIDGDSKFAATRTVFVGDAAFFNTAPGTEPDARGAQGLVVFVPNDVELKAEPLCEEHAEGLNNGRPEAIAELTCILSPGMPFCVPSAGPGGFGSQFLVPKPSAGAMLALHDFGALLPLCDSYVPLEVWRQINGADADPGELLDFDEANARNMKAREAQSGTIAAAREGRAGTAAN